MSEVKKKEVSKIPTKKNNTISKKVIKKPVVKNIEESSKELNMNLEKKSELDKQVDTAKMVEEKHFTAKNLFLRILFFILIAYGCIFAFDFLAMLNSSKPLIVIDTYTYNYDGFDYTEYTSLGYKVIIKSQGFLQEGKVAFLWTNTTPDMEFIVRDETGDVCMSKETIFYEDKHYTYAFNCEKVITVEIDSEIYSVTEALLNELITIEQLAEQINFISSKKVMYSFEISKDSCNVLLNEEIYLKKEADGLYSYCLKRLDTIINLDNRGSFSNYYNTVLDGNLIDNESILNDTTLLATYLDGSKMYTGYGINIIECSNSSLVFGQQDMIYSEFMCK